MKNTSLQVVLEKCIGYDRSLVTELVDGAANLLGLSGGLHGQTVLLKPNLISAGGPKLACTHSEFIAGVALWFIEQGARVLLGDSPALGRASHVCEKQSITAALAGLDVQFVEFKTPLLKKLPCDRTVTVASEALECDLFVGLPKVKAHNQMYVTLAVKNIFGIVKGVNKAKLHMSCGNSHEEFSRIILDLIALLPRQCHFVDGIIAMHISGPLDGTQLPLHCFAASKNPVAMDTALLDILQVESKKSPLWSTANNQKISGSDGNSIEYLRNQPSDFYNSGFLAPEGLDPIRFSPLRFLSGMAKRLNLAVRG